MVDPAAIVPSPIGVPHMPDVESMHRAPHANCPVGHEIEQALAAQTYPEGHAVPHVPQFSRSFDRSRQTPLQFVSPAPHETWQALEVQTWPEGHATPQPPQLNRS